MPSAEDKLMDKLERGIDLLIEEEDWEKVFQECEEHIEKFPERARFYCLHGIARMGMVGNRLDTYGEAIKDFNRAINKRREYPRAYLHRGIAKMEMSIFEEAKEDLSQAIHLLDTTSMKQPDEKRMRVLAEESIDKIRVRQREKLDQDILDRNKEMVTKTLQDIQIIRKREQSRHRECRLARVRWIRYLWVALVFSLALSFFWDKLGEWFYGLSISAPVDPFTFLLRTLSITGTITAPIIYQLRIISRDAEEAKVLAYDYHRMLLAESRIRVNFEDEPKLKSALYERLINHWIDNGPIETLLRMKNLSVDNDSPDLLRQINETMKRFGNRHQATE